MFALCEQPGSFLHDLYNFIYTKLAVCFKTKTGIEFCKTKLTYEISNDTIIAIPCNAIKVQQR